MAVLETHLRINWSGLLFLFFGIMVTVGTFLPWLSSMIPTPFGGMNISGIDIFNSYGDSTGFSILGIIVLMLGLLMVTLSLFDRRGKKNTVVHAVLTIVGITVAVSAFVVSNDLLNVMNGAVLQSMNYEYGLFIVLMAGIGTTSAGVLTLAGFMD